MKILLTGANGLLGKTLLRKLQQNNHEIVATAKDASRLANLKSRNTAFHSLDITDGDAVYKLITFTKPDVIIHAAAMTQVDQCELNKIDCWNTNVTATRFIVDAARETKSRLIFISTDFIFDGISGPYKEDDLPNPVNYYGSSKLAAEKAIMESGLSWAIVRTILVIGKTEDDQRQNIISWVKEELEKGEKIKVVDDQVRTPTFVDDLADGIMLILEKNATGIFHIAGKDTLTPYQVATKTAAYLELDTSLIEKVDAGSFTQAALRPPKTGFVIEKAKKDLGYEPRSFNEILSQIFSETPAVIKGP